MAKAQTPAEMQKKYKDLLATNGSLICTEDGQAFYNTAKGRPRPPAPFIKFTSFKAIV